MTSLAAELHLLAGLGAMTLGAATLHREPRRSRNRLFALLCAAMGLWNIGYGALTGLQLSSRITDAIYLLGSCATAPLACHLAATLSGSRRLSRLTVPIAYALAGGLWLSSWMVPPDWYAQWSLTALLLLGLILMVTLGMLLVHASSLRRGAERNAYMLLVVAGAIAAAGGLSDFLPRGTSAIPKLGPVAVLLFLLMMSAILSRQRFFDVHRFVARAVGFLAAGASIALVLYAVGQLTGHRFVFLFLVVLVVLAIAGSMGRILKATVSSLVRPEDSVLRALTDVSRRLPAARSPDEVRIALESARGALPGDARVALWLSRPERDLFEPFFNGGGSTGLRGVEAASPLPLILRQERLPITRAFLEVEARGGRPAAGEALKQLEAAGAELMVPVMDGDELAGWVEIGGGSPRAYVTGKMASAFLSIGGHALAGLRRLEALDVARRRGALAAVGEMSASLAHEIRNPVGAIQGAAQVLAEESDPRRTREMLDVILEESGRLGRVLGGILEDARPAATRREPVDLAQLAQTVLRSAAAAGLGMNTSLEVASSTPLIQGDPDQLHSAFMNLVRNAREAAGSRGTLRIVIAPAEPRSVSIRFEDNGPGIPDDRRGELFHPFRSTRAEGTGLGLAHVDRIVKDHGGRIEVGGRAGDGATFTIVLPNEGGGP